MFRFDHSPITGVIDAMRQSRSFILLDGGNDEVGAFGVTIVDVTDIGIAQDVLRNREKRLTEALAELTASHVELFELNRQLAVGIVLEINNPVQARAHWRLPRVLHRPNPP
ncbi:hypothetical protein WS69_09890 [Burkholderia sp. BDU5]|nr:hypothetical protein WS69_09890 [Burkholderia sp. BDU5]